ncbi:MAG: hypothetical protein LBM98_04505 [Oscillospiraceae bacterium]|nr:hypothetical protein [Oscillospiraceae bacterium]
MLRTCNLVRIASVPVLRNDGAPSGAPRARRGEPPRRYAAPLPGGEFTGEGGFETRPYVPP